MPPETMADTQNEALLKLKILDGENLKDFKQFARAKAKSFILAWIDPRFKQSTQTLTTSHKNPTWNFDLDFPLSLQTLQNFNSCVTVQVVSPAFHQQRVVGTAVLPISDVGFREQVFTLQLWRPSGRVRGLVRVMARVEINLGFYTLAESTAPSRDNVVLPSAPMEDRFTELQMSGPVDTDPVELSQLDFDRRDEVESNFDSTSSCSSVHSPPVDRVPTEKVEMDSNSGQLQSADVDPRKNVESVCNCGSRCNSVQLPLCDLPTTNTTNKVVLHCNCGSSNSSCNSAFPESRDDSPNVLRSLLVGFLGGAVAVATVLIGGANG